LFIAAEKDYKPLSEVNSLKEGNQSWQQKSALTALQGACSVAPKWRPGLRRAISNARTAVLCGTKKDACL